MADQTFAGRVRALDAGGHVVALAFLGETLAIATGEGEVILAATDELRIKAHAGAILAAVADGARLYSAGDDGRLIAVDGSGATEVLAEAAGKWIDRVALGPDGAFAWSAGRTAFVHTKKGVRSLEVPSTVGGLAFAPKGLRLAVTHRDGATLWFPQTEAEPHRLEWKGSHLGAVFSPDGRFLVTTMQEPTLHGWRLADGQHMRMSGYPTRVRSLSFSADGDWLASSGAREVVLWPFRTRDGPMGKAPLMRAPGAHDARVTAVACHPKEAVFAAGYSDGAVNLVRLADGAAIPASDASGAPVSALGWRRDGRALAFGCEDGRTGLLAL